MVLRFCVQCICVSSGTTCQIDFFGRKLTLKVSTVPNQFNGSISKSAVNLEIIGRGQILAYHVTPSPPGQIEQKLAIFKTCSDSFNMGVVRSVLMPVVTLPSFKMIGRLEVRLRYRPIETDLAR